MRERWFDVYLTDEKVKELLESGLLKKALNDVVKIMFDKFKSGGTPTA